MRSFINENFMLQNKTAVTLYHEYVKDLPIIDYHCHISPREIAENKRYKNITEVWLGGDHYKWRAIRANGIDEKYITGDADPKEKFMKWAETVPYLLGNPLYHWTHLELKRYFGIDDLLSPKTAEKIWERCNELLSTDELSARGIIKSSNVELICTTDDPTDTLEYHKAIREDESFTVRVLPTFRPDKALNIASDGFIEYIGSLEKAANREVSTISDLKQALEDRISYFHENGCRISDHALEYCVYEEADESTVDKIFKKILNGEKITQQEADQYKTHMLVFLGREYAKRGWAMQLHLNSIRNLNTRMFSILGPDTGYDAIGDAQQAKGLAAFLNSLEKTGELPRTILYSLNPYDNEVLATIMGCFQGSEVPGKIQLGSGWWFNDQKEGMVTQMKALANMGLLRRFVGMLTDSRSFLSYTRHEYFRRILCNLIGEWAEAGEVPQDMDLLGSMVREISYYNAKNYFVF
ncbi:MAG: glucuronate isomerase [Clostridiaceae bacterium]|nr:glucuronate isomerase [Clostridiaceae bacterium]